MGGILDERPLDGSFALERESLGGRDGVDGLGMPYPLVGRASGRDDRWDGRIEVEDLVDDAVAVRAGEEGVPGRRSAERIEGIEPCLGAREGAV